MNFKYSWTQINEVPFRVHYANASHQTEWLFKMQPCASKKIAILAIVSLNLANNKTNHLFMFTPVHKFLIVMELDFITQTSSMTENQVLMVSFQVRYLNRKGTERKYLSN